MMSVKMVPTPQEEKRRRRRRRQDLARAKGRARRITALWWSHPAPTQHFIGWMAGVHCCPCSCVLCKGPRYTRRQRYDWLENIADEEDRWLARMGRLGHRQARR
jgi:hypothetical protein